MSQNVSAGTTASLMWTVVGGGDVVGVAVAVVGARHAVASGVPEGPDEPPAARLPFLLRAECDERLPVIVTLAVSVVPRGHRPLVAVTLRA